MARRCWKWALGVSHYIVVIVGMALMMGSGQAAQFQVGGSAGWTLPNIGNINYTTWQAAQTFVVGDTLYFNYSKEYHNVMVVTRGDYEACNSSNPISTYDDGETLITLDRSGTFYFLCGVPSHCVVGQKVAVKVRRHAISSPPTPSPIASSPQSILSPSPIIGLTPTTSQLGITKNDTSQTSLQHSFMSFFTLASPILLCVPLLLS